MKRGDHQEEGADLCDSSKRQKGATVAANDGNPNMQPYYDFSGDGSPNRQAQVNPGFSQLPNHLISDLFALARSPQPALDSRRSSVDALSQAPIRSPNALLNLQLQESVLRRQLELSNQVENRLSGFNAADLIRLSQQQQQQQQQSNSSGSSLPFYQGQGYQDLGAMGSNQSNNYVDPRITAALAARVYPDIFSGQHQHQQHQNHQHASALAQSVLMSRAGAPMQQGPAPHASHQLPYASGSIDIPYGALNRLTGSLAPQEASRMSSVDNDSLNHDDRYLPMALPSDDENLSEYQALIRKQIFLFEARADDVDSNAQGRNRPIVLGQVGIQCRYCCALTPGRRTRGSVYFPAKLPGLYQAAQNMAINHFTDSCQHIPEETRAKIRLLKEQKTSFVVGGKQYWANGARVLGVRETEENGLDFDQEAKPRRRTT